MGAKDRNREIGHFRAGVVECADADITRCDANEFAGRCGIHKPDTMDRMNVSVIRLADERSARRGGVA